MPPHDLGGPPPYKAERLMKSVTMSVWVKNSPVVFTRLWLGVQLCRLAAWVGGLGWAGTRTNIDSVERCQYYHETGDRCNSPAQLWAVYGATPEDYVAGCEAHIYALVPVDVDANCVTLLREWWR